MVVASSPSVADVADIVKPRVSLSVTETTVSAIEPTLTRVGGVPKLIVACLPSLSMKSSRAVTLNVLLVSVALKLTLLGMFLITALLASPP